MACPPGLQKTKHHRRRIETGPGWHLRQLRQDIAVTGSVNQHGQVQPVGGVSEKIEGFFDACRLQGLTGEQGVLIPAANRRHLMLRDDVIDAVRADRFHIWTSEAVDDGLELLTGRPAGRPGDDGSYPEGTLHRAVADQIAQHASIVRAAAGDTARSGQADDQQAAVSD